jgi:hypothetical protein
MITVTGERLIGDAQRSAFTTGKSILVLRVQPQGSFLIEARVAFEDSPTGHQLAEYAATRCLKGDLIAFSATTVPPRTDHDVAAVLMRGVTNLSVNGTALRLR